MKNEKNKKWTASSASVFTNTWKTNSIPYAFFVCKDLDTWTSASFTIGEDESSFSINYSLAGRGAYTNKTYYNATFKWDGQHISNYEILTDSLAQSPYSQLTGEFTKENLEFILQQSIKDFKRKLVATNNNDNE